MKKLILALAALMVSLAAYGQGQFVFNNRVPPDINAKFGLSTGVTPGSDATVYTVQLLGGPSGSAQSTWTEIGTTTFRTGNAAGYVNPITVTVPGATTSADFKLSVFTGTSTTGTALGTLATVFTTPVAIAPNPPPNAPLGTAAITFSAVPEPTTLALGLIGVGSLLFIRRRK